MQETCVEHDLKKVILGEAFNQNYNQNDYFSHLYKVTEEVIEKPELASITNDPRLRDYDLTDIADILYSSDDNPSKVFKIKG